MVDRKNILTAVATLAVVAGLGYSMQNGGAVAGLSSADLSNARTLSVGSDRPDGTVAAQYLPAPPKAALMSYALPVPDVTGATRVAALTETIGSGLRTDAPTPIFLPSSCEVSLTALPEDGAMVRLELNAPCYRNQRITISHAGLEIADVTGVDGSFSVGFPALSEFAPFLVTFANGTKVEAKTLQLSLAGYERVAVSWTGAPVLRIHAMEFGAGFGQAGHVWAEAANEAPRTDGGSLFRLGNPGIMSPKLAEIYSINSGETKKDGSIDFRVEAELNGQSCSREISGRSFQLSADGTLTSTSIEFSLPPCGGENGYLLLNNLFQDLKIARN